VLVWHPIHCDCQTCQPGMCQWLASQILRCTTWSSSPTERWHMINKEPSDGCLAHHPVFCKTGHTLTLKVELQVTL
jgi:hypothetical protein